MILQSIVNRVVGVVDRVAEKVSRWKTPANDGIPDDLRVLDSGVKYTEDGILEYLWYYLEERPDGGPSRRVYKAVCLRLLTYIPREVREQTNRVEKTRKALLGLWAARADPVVLRGYLPGYGAIQVYGAQAIGNSLEEAIARAQHGMTAVLAVLSNYEQARFEPLDVGLTEAIRRAFREMQSALTIVGHPDPREGAAGMVSGGADAQRSIPRSEMGTQQTEMLLRGAATQGIPFLAQLMLGRAGDGDPRSIYDTQERITTLLSIFESQIRGTRSASFFVSLPFGLGDGRTESASAGYGMGRGESQQYSSSQSVGRAHTEGTSDGTFWSHATSRGESWGEADTSGSTWSHTVSHTTGVADGTSHTRSEAWGTADTHGTATTSGSGSSVVVTQGVAMNQSYNIGADAIIVSGGGSVGLTQSVARAEGFSSFSSTSSMSSHTDSHSWGFADGTSHTISSSTTVADSSGGFSSHTTSHSTSVTETEGRGGSHVVSRADSTSTGMATARGYGTSSSTARGQSLALAYAQGFSVGVVPGIALSESWQTRDATIEAVANVLAVMARNVDTIGVEGGYYADYYVICPPEARDALEALILQAYHGLEDVATRVRCRRLSPSEEDHILHHAVTFTPSLMRENNPWAIEPWRHSSLLTMVQAAAYFLPASFEQGMANTVQEQIPPLAFVPNMQGPVMLGHQYSYEISTREPTEEPVRMALDQMSNWAFCADTRMGKSVAAERLVYELVEHAGFRVVVMDYGAGWAKMLTALPRGKVDYWSLAPWGARPIRWNFLQIGERISPREQMTATVELLCTAGRMGERQAGFMVQTLEELYISKGVLTFDYEVQMDHEKWGFVQDDEWAVLDEARQKRGLAPRPRRPKTWLKDLEDFELQTLAVHRSKRVDAREWFDRISVLARTVKDPTSKSALEGVRLRLQHLVKGQIGQMYGAGEGSIAMENLAPPTGGLTILAGGARMSEYARSALLALMTYHLYTDSVVRREERLSGATYPPLFIVLEEANKVIAGADSSGNSERGIQSDIIPSFFRDAGKYGVYLCAIVQSPASLPPGILSSCNNVAVGQLKNPDDVKAVMSAMARSPHGFIDVPYAHLVGILEPGQFLLRLGLARGGRGNYPMLYRPLMVQSVEPSPQEIVHLLTNGNGA